MAPAWKEAAASYSGPATGLPLVGAAAGGRSLRLVRGWLTEMVKQLVNVRLNLEVIWALGLKFCTMIGGYVGRGLLPAS